MPDSPDVIDQIEYRWDDTLDLSPVASTMQKESLAGWKPWIRGWVRHPHVEGLWESLCYQVQPGGRAALAWRYEDWQAAERDGAPRGRPLVSRVLAGHQSVLTPEAAIALCYTGLPAAAGPRPGQVTAGSQLPVIRAAELSALVSGQADKLDEEAGWQDGLTQVVAAALYSPQLPLAIHIRDTYILKPPAEGLQCPMLWGLRRIVWPVLGDAGRGWSFSTFEPPLGGDVDPADLPAILFRQAQDTPPLPPSRPRREIKSRPFDPIAMQDSSQVAQLAGWLVGEYRERGGDEFGRLIAEWCGTERSWSQRSANIYKALAKRHAPIAPPAGAQERKPDRFPAPAKPAESAPFSLTPAAGEEGSGPRTPAGASPIGSDKASSGNRDAGLLPEWGRPTQPSPVPAPGPSQAGDEQQPDSAGQPATGRRGNTAEYWDDPPEPSAQQRPAAPEHADPGYRDDLTVPDVSSQPDEPAWPTTHDPTAPKRQETTWAAQRDDLLGQVQRPGKAPELRPGSHGAPPPLEAGQRSHVSPAVSDLLKRLPAAADAEEFESILHGILDRDTEPDSADRVKARREVSKDEWYEQVRARFDLLDLERLSEIFCLIVIPDLGNPDVTKKIGDWAERAHQFIIAGLLLAARLSGDDTWHSMMRILQPKLAYRWTSEHQMQPLWDPGLAAQPAGESGRRFSFFRKNDR